MILTENSTDVRPGRGPAQVDTKDSLGIHTEKGGASATIFDGSGRSIAIIALILASLAIGALLLLPAYIEAKVEAGKAEALVVAKEARTHSRVALDDVQRLREAMHVTKEH